MANLIQAFITLNQKMGKPLSQNYSNYISTFQYVILCLIAMGKTLPEITEIMAKLTNKSYSRSTLKFIIQDHIYKRFDVCSDDELIKRAVAIGIINPTLPISINIVKELKND